jgi:predicted dienelactone hydrolase
MVPAVLALHDEARDRALPTTVYVPENGTSQPLIVFAHGVWGHPRKFRWLLARWVASGYVVAAPAFPHTSDENPPPYLKEDVANQPADVSFVLDEVLALGFGNPERVGVGGYSLGAATALAVGLHPRYADPRLRAVVAVAGGLFHHAAFARDRLLPVPLLLVHGSDDKGYREAMELYDEAQEPKELVTIAGAGHRICEDDAQPHATRVAEVTATFWNRYLRADGVEVGVRVSGAS